MQHVYAGSKWSRIQRQGGAKLAKWHEKGREGGECLDVPIRLPYQYRQAYSHLAERVHGIKPFVQSVNEMGE